MSKKTVKIVAIVIAAIFLLGIFGPMAYMLVFSEPADGYGLESVAEEDMQEKIERLTAEAEAAEARLNEAENRLSSAEQLESNISQDAGKRFRVMCEKGLSSYVDILFTAGSAEDFIDRIVIARELAEYDKNVMSALKKLKNEIAQNKSDAEEQLAELNKLKSELELLDYTD